MSNKTFTNKSNAARAAKKANEGTLTGLTLHGEPGAWYYSAAAPVIARSAGAGAVAILIDATAKPITFASAAAAMGKALKVHTTATKAAARKAAPPLPAKAKAKAKAKPTTRRAASAAVPVATGGWDGATQGRITGYKIDPNRDERHGVKQRSHGTIGGNLWAIFDKLAKGAPEKLPIADVKVHKLTAAYNANKVMIEFYLWRRYNGVRGRGSKQKVD